ncbi:hypothetical protein [Chitinimonas naiadis]
MKRRHWLLLGGFLLAGYLAIWGNEPPPVAQAGTLPKPAAQSASARPAPAIVPASTIALIPREQLMQEPAKQAGGNPFAARQLPAPAVTAPPPVATVAPVPTAPPLPFQFLGKKLEDGVWEVYLDAANQTLIVHSGDKLLGNYRVDEIRPPNMMLTYLPLDMRQTLVIGQGEE